MRIGKVIFGAIFALSLALNAFFMFDRSGRPDVDFYGTSKRDAYLIKAREREGVFVIRHRDSSEVHLYTAKCEVTLTWLDGVVNPAHSMGDGCTYIPNLIGKTIAGGKMRKEGSTIVYVPWANDDTVQTADVLTILNDERVN